MDADLPLYIKIKAAENCAEKSQGYYLEPENTLSVEELSVEFNALERIIPANLMPYYLYKKAYKIVKTLSSARRAVEGAPLWDAVMATGDPYYMAKAKIKRHNLESSYY